MNIDRPRQKKSICFPRGRLYHSCQVERDKNGNGGKKPWNGSKQAFPSTSPEMQKKHENVADGAREVENIDCGRLPTAKLKLQKETKNHSRESILLNNNKKASTFCSCTNNFWNISYFQEENCSDYITQR